MQASWPHAGITVNRTCSLNDISGSAVSKKDCAGCGNHRLHQSQIDHHHHHQITKLSHSINAIGPAPHRSGRKSRRLITVHHQGNIASLVVRNNLRPPWRRLEKQVSAHQQNNMQRH
jgi:hypothetical protein